MPQTTSGGLLSVDAASRNRILKDVLKGVSRSFYLTLRVLPKNLREPIGLAYLLARAAATISERKHTGLRGSRIQGLETLRTQVIGPADVTVRIYNASGRLERVMVREEPMAPGRVILKWDGLDEDQKIVGSGLYIIAVDAGGQRSEKVVAVVQ